MVYQWKENIPFAYPVEAQKAGEELERITKRDGSILPLTVVDESEPKGAPLHSCFEWDNITAAGKYREGQARSLIKNLVTVNVVKREENPIVSFVSVKMTSEKDEPKRYISIDAAMQNESYKAQVLRDALNQLNALRRKYKDLQELAGVFKEIEKLA